MLIRMADGKTHFIDYRERAPAAATANMYLDSHGKRDRGCQRGRLQSDRSAGSVAGMVYAERKYGKLSLEKVIAPAIKLAEDGFALTAQDVKNLRDDKHLAQFPESRRIFQRDGNYYKAGDVFKQPDVARTLKRIAANPDDFYHGAMAHELAAAMQKGGGLITANDLARYEVKEREAMRGSYRGYDIISAPPPSSGGTALLETLNILEGYDLAKFRAALPLRYT